MLWNSVPLLSFTKKQKKLKKKVFYNEQNLHTFVSLHGYVGYLVAAIDTTFHSSENSAFEFVNGCIKIC